MRFMKQYDALFCTSDPSTLEILAAASSGLPITGLLDNGSSIVLYFNEGEFQERFIDDLRTWIPEGELVSFELGTVEEQNWNAEFEQSLNPIALGDDLIITQSWNPVEAPESALVITIDPKMSFGTGHHESTRLIAQLMLELDFTGKSVLDIGTGTGVLAILAAKKGAGRIVAFDNNEWAVENTRENLASNDTDNDVQLFLGELGDLDKETGTDTDGFDIILANLHRNLIMELLPDIVHHFSKTPTPYLLTSGVLYQDYEGLCEAAAAHGLKPVSERRENEWISTIFGRA